MERIGRSMTVTERLQNLFFPVLFVGVVGWASVSMIWDATHRKPTTAKPKAAHWERSFRGTWKALAGDRSLKLDGRGSATLMRGELTISSGTWAPTSEARVEVKLGDETIQFMRGRADQHSGVDLYILSSYPEKQALMSRSYYRLDGPEDERYVDPMDYE